MSANNRAEKENEAKAIAEAKKRKQLAEQREKKEKEELLRREEIKAYYEAEKNLAIPFDKNKFSKETIKFVEKQRERERKSREIVNTMESFALLILQALFVILLFYLIWGYLLGKTSKDENSDEKRFADIVDFIFSLILKIFFWEKIKGILIASALAFGAFLITVFPFIRKLSKRVNELERKVTVPSNINSDFKETEQTDPIELNLKKKNVLDQWISLEAESVNNDHNLSEEERRKKLQDLETEYFARLEKIRNG